MREAAARLGVAGVIQRADLGPQGVGWDDLVADGVPLGLVFHDEGNKGEFLGPAKNAKNKIPYPHFHKWGTKDKVALSLSSGNNVNLGPTANLLKENLDAAWHSVDDAVIRTLLTTAMGKAKPVMVAPAQPVVVAAPRKSNRPKKGMGGKGDKYAGWKPAQDDWDVPVDDDGSGSDDGFGL